MAILSYLLLNIIYRYPRFNVANYLKLTENFKPCKIMIISKVCRILYSNDGYFNLQFCCLKTELKQDGKADGTYYG